MLKLLEPAIARRISEVTVICDNNNDYKELKELLGRINHHESDSPVEKIYLETKLKKVISSIVEETYRSAFKDGMYVVIKME